MPTKSIYACMHACMAMQNYRCAEVVCLNHLAYTYSMHTCSAPGPSPITRLWMSGARSAKCMHTWDICKLVEMEKSMQNSPAGMPWQLSLNYIRSKNNPDCLACCTIQSTAHLWVAGFSKIHGGLILGSELHDGEPSWPAKVLPTQKLHDLEADCMLPNIIWMGKLRSAIILPCH